MRRAVVAAIIVGVMGSGATACQKDKGGSDADRKQGTTGEAPKVSDQDGRAGDGDLRVEGVFLSVTPGTLAGVRCKSAFMETFIGTISFADGHKGGRITISYGGSSGGMKQEKIEVPAGKKSITKTFAYSEFLYGASIAAGQLNVLEPNRVGSATVRPTGTCTEGGTWGGTTAGTTGGGTW
ncbi:hypothetical protein [Embleya sp. NPDC020886]|uniref:hypothetical protein n=1 Tax=Embleya sp. NPDC020886 TaxID=3363980 RepID=UPI0037B86C5F